MNINCNFGHRGNIIFITNATLNPLIKTISLIPINLLFLGLFILLSLICIKNINGTNNTIGNNIIQSIIFKVIIKVKFMSKLLEKNNDKIT